MSKYKPLKIKLLEISGLYPSVLAMRLPIKGSSEKSDSYIKIDDRVFVGREDKKLLSKLVKAGNGHEKASRGIWAYFEMEFSITWMIELDTYRIGSEVLSTSSSMNYDLAGIKGMGLAQKKQDMASDKYYKRIQMFSYPTLRRIYQQRRHHRHPDWGIFCDYMETLPHFDEFIMPDKG
jgi:hypothetical protein